MKLSESFWQTYKEAPKDAQIISHILMIRAGLIHKSGMGLYNYLPYGYRSIRKVEQIVREEMNKIAEEICMSVVTPGELWQESGRWKHMAKGPDRTMAIFKDKKERDLCLSPTNEEAVVDVFRNIIKSYKQLPISLYQINTKFRDEIRPRFGLMRGREFTMKDAYSFHTDKPSLDEIYERFYHAYHSIFKRIGLNFRVVEADAGTMGEADSKTHEFQVIAKSGEDEIVYCQETGYAANIERAATLRGNNTNFSNDTTLEEIHTPNAATIEGVSIFLKCPAHHCLKSLVYIAFYKNKEVPVLVQILGDDTLNEIKLKKILNCDQLLAATDGQLTKLGFIKGFIGGHGLLIDSLKIVIDSQVDLHAGYVAGANRQDYHFKGLVPERDIPDFQTADIRLAQEGDLTLDKKGCVKLCRGIEVGHIFQLGDKYTRSMNVTVLGKNGTPIYPLMGCYGIGITRIVAAAIEQNHDDKGILWPQSIAPYHVHLILLGKSKELHEIALKIYRQLWDCGIETLLDDRKVGTGFKFKDADLLGLPWQLVLGEKNYNNGRQVELIERKTGKRTLVSEKEVISHAQNILEL